MRHYCPQLDFCGVSPARFPHWGYWSTWRNMELPGSFGMQNSDKQAWKGGTFLVVRAVACRRRQGGRK